MVGGVNMTNVFKNGDKVHHRNLNMYGTFTGYDKWDTDTCYVNFMTKDGYDDERRVTISQVERA